MIAWDVTSAARALARGEVSPVELTQAALARIDSLDSTVDAFARVCHERALRDAQRAEDELGAGRRRGPLHGIPYAAKDLYDTAGIETNAGSRALAGRVPDTDAACIQRLTSAGAVLLGKTRAHEFAYGVTTPPTRNPLDIDRTAGGSSGGSAAAVSAGYCSVTLGTDTGGSIRIPAALCGVVGLRPTIGRVSTRGVIPLAWSLDTAGPICRTVRDAAVVLNALTDRYSPSDDASKAGVDDDLTDLEAGVKGFVLGVPRNYFFDRLDPAVEHAVRRAITRLGAAGAILREIDLPLTEHALSAMFAICLPEAAEAHGALFPKRAALYGEDVRRYLELGALRPATEYVRAQRVRAAITAAWRPILESYDAILAPTLPAVAAQVGQQELDLPSGPEPIVSAYLRLAAPASVVGLPSLSVPCGTTDGGLPVGLQIMARPFAERRVLRIGCAVEESHEDPPSPLDERLATAGTSEARGGHRQ